MVEIQPTTRESMSARGSNESDGVGLNHIIVYGRCAYHSGRSEPNLEESEQGQYLITASAPEISALTSQDLFEVLVKLEPVRQKTEEEEEYGKAEEHEA